MIKVGFCVAYDWALLKLSLPRIYERADKICLSIDRNRRSWTGTPYSFDQEAFRTWLSGVDPQNKIDLYEDDFALPNLSAMENDTRQRNLMAKRLGKGGWHIQIDCDEYFLNFNSFTERLKKVHLNPTGNEKPLTVCVCLVPLIKKLPNGFLYVDFKNQFPEISSIATNFPDYTRARNSGQFHQVFSEFVIHETWARSDDELQFKLNNWGHSSDELKQLAIRKSYYSLWKALDEHNYQYISNFHPAIANVWPALAFKKADSIEDFMKNFSSPELPISALNLMLRNNRNVARIKSIYNKVFG